MKRQRTQRNVTMVDIATATGLSLATVGRVLHDTGYVSAESRKKIEAYIQKTGYVPNKIAQGLKSRQSKLIGHLVVFNPNMLFAKISLAVNAAAREQGLHVLTMTSHKGLEEDEALVNELIGHRVDGVVVTSNVSMPKAAIQKLVDRNIPVVMIERTLAVPRVDRIRVDDLGGARLAVQHLLDHGHRRVGFIGMHLFHEVERLRLAGYRDALLGAGQTAQDDLVRLMAEYSPEAGKQAMESFLAAPEPPTAVFATSDLFIGGVLQALHARGLRVPHDLSLVGYDDTLAAMFAPPITSVGLSLDDVGRQAIDLLLKRQPTPAASARTLTLGTVLIDRGSVACMA
ncbi:MAG TPA: LacI family DNA-binding transcriptional regulator [Anaerolineales bacterium]|nr:LacI family DNA-binding transcriptional regulator [Anaerolineales bacterium]HRF46810.1 LacI family DNA-binding transcriptional regulator [Anaerolineales bacterium]